MVSGSLRLGRNTAVVVAVIVVVVVVVEEASRSRFMSWSSASTRDESYEEGKQVLSCCMFVYTLVALSVWLFVLASAPSPHSDSGHGYSRL
jgi:hypothetical protein